jgi:hypothetical protein
MRRYLPVTHSAMIRKLPLTSLILIGTALCAFAVTEENVKKQLAVPSGGKVVVDVDFGTIDVAAGVDTQVEIDANRKIETDDEAQEKAFFGAAPVTITQEGNTVTIRARRERQTDWQWGKHVVMDARYTVHLPKSFDADLKTGGGNIAVADLNGMVNVDTKGGRLRLMRIHGPIEGRTNGGNVDLADCEGAHKIHTSGGNIESKGGSGALEAHTSGGHVTIRNFSGRVDTASNGGNLTFEKVGGELVGKTSGGTIVATLLSPVPGNASLETSAGTIEVAVPPNAGLKVDATAHAGKIVSDLPFTATDSAPESLKAAINGGGRLLTLRTSAGNIQIKAGPIETAGR